MLYIVIYGYSYIYKAVAKLYIATRGYDKDRVHSNSSILLDSVKGDL